MMFSFETYIWAIFEVLDMYILNKY